MVVSHMEPADFAALYLCELDGEKLHRPPMVALMAEAEVY